MKTIVTGGAKGADIDVFGCAVGYAELLRAEGVDAEAVVQGTFTASVTPSILALNGAYLKKYTSQADDNFVLVDISDPDHLPQFVSKERIVEVFDHRSGYEHHWQRLQKGNHIELVGACGTLIWEEYVRRNKTKVISNPSAVGLLASIVSNNLALRSPITTERDQEAFKALSGITGLTDSWIGSYYREQETELLKNFAAYVDADTKTFNTPSGEFVIAQIELWEASEILEDRKEEISRIMQKYEPRPWIVNVLSINEGCNYIFSRSDSGVAIVKKKFGFNFVGDTATTDGLFMRKWLMRDLLKP